MPDRCRRFSWGCFALFIAGVVTLPAGAWAQLPQIAAQGIKLALPLAKEVGKGVLQGLGEEGARATWNYFSDKKTNQVDVAKLDELTALLAKLQSEVQGLNRTQAADISALRQSIYQYQAASAENERALKAAAAADRAELLARLEAAQAKLTEQLQSKLSREQVVSIVRQSLDTLSQDVERIGSDIRQVDDRVALVSQRVKSIEAIFEYVPVTAPQPLMRPALVEGPAASGKPGTHPLFGEWAQLLARQEALRQRALAARARSLYGLPGAADELKPELDSLRDEIAALRTRIAGEHSALAKKRAQIAASQNGAALRDFDRSLSPLTWLLAVSLPSGSEESSAASSLSIPRQFLAHEASDIVAAYAAGGKEAKDLVPIMRTLLTVPADNANDGSQQNPPDARQQADLKPVFAVYGQIETNLAEWVKLAQDCQTTRFAIERALASGTELSAPVVELRLTQKKQCKSIRGRLEASQSLIGSGLAAYLGALQTRRPALEILQHLWGRLQSLQALVGGFEYVPWDSPSGVDECWEQLGEWNAPLTDREALPEHLAAARMVLKIEHAHLTRIAAEDAAREQQARQRQLDEQNRRAAAERQRMAAEQRRREAELAAQKAADKAAADRAKQRFGGPAQAAPPARPKAAPTLTVTSVSGFRAVFRDDSGSVKTGDRLHIVRGGERVGIVEVSTVSDKQVTAFSSTITRVGDKLELIR